MKMDSLEDLYISQQPGAEIRRAQLAVRHTRPVAKVHTSSAARKAPAHTSAQADKSVSPSKRASLFSRRKSLVPAPSSAQHGSCETVQRVHTAPAARRQSMNEAIAGIDVDTLKTKILSSLHSNKRVVCGTLPSTLPTTRTHAAKPSPTRDTRQRATTIGGMNEIQPQNQDADQMLGDPCHISKPFGFQHLARIEKSPRPETTIHDLAQASIAAFNFHASNHDQIVRPQSRTAPVRPKRPEDHDLPTGLLSPRFGLQTLRHIRSAEVMSSAVPVMASKSLVDTSLAAPERSSSLPVNNALHLAAPIKQASLTSLLEDSHYDSNILDSIDMGHISSSNALLEQVAEESEGTITPRPARPVGQIRSTATATRASPLTTLSHFDDLEPFLPRISLLPSIMLPRPVSGGSDTLGDLSLRPFDIETEFYAKQTSEVVDEFDFNCSWDEDIVFSYNLGAEAHSDFDWSNTSAYLDTMDETSDSVVMHEVPVIRGRRHEYTDSWASTTGSDFAVNIHHSLLGCQAVPTHDSVPELEDHVLSHSGSSSSLIVGTPQDQCGFLGFDPFIATSPASNRRSGDGLEFISPQLPPLGLKNNLDSDKLFDDLMAGFTFKQRSATLPVLEAKTFHDGRMRSVSDAQRALQAPTSAPSVHVPRSSVSPTIRSSDASLFTMRVCMEPEVICTPVKQSPRKTVKINVPASKSSSPKRGKTHSDWPQLITKSSSEFISATPRSSAESSRARDAYSPSSPSKPTTITRKSVRSMHKKAASADGLPLSKYTLLTMSAQSSLSARNLATAPADELACMSAWPVSRVRRLTTA